MLEVKNLTLGYDGRIVLKDISFVVQKGELFGVIGPNGSGKSTLIRAISAVLHPNSGKIMLEGKDVARVSRREISQIIGVVPQNPYLPESITAFDLVLMGRNPHLGLLRYESKRDMEIAYQAMELAQTHTLAGRRVGELSGGERQRLVISRALAQQPKLMLLDEPTAHLDLSFQIGILSLVRQLSREQNLTTILALHDLNLAAQYCDRLILLKDGAISAEGRPMEVLTPEKIKEVYGADVLVHPHPINGLPLIILRPVN